MNIARFPQSPALFDAAARHVADELTRLAKSRLSVTFAVCGGRSVTEIFRRLVPMPGVPFDKVHVFMADERVVPMDHPDWNGALVEQGLMAPLVASGRIPPGNWHPFHGDPAAPDFGASPYTHELLSRGGAIHLLLLSAGEDGHIASLFPGLNHGPEAIGFIPVHNSPKPPARRVSLTAHAIRTAESTVVLVTGEAKRAALDSLIQGKDAASCPAIHARSAKRHAVFTDLG